MHRVGGYVGSVPAGMHTPAAKFRAEEISIAKIGADGCLFIAITVVDIEIKGEGNVSVAEEHFGAGVGSIAHHVVHHLEVGHVVGGNAVLGMRRKQEP